MGMSNRSDVKELFALRNQSRFDHPPIAVYIEVDCFTFTNLNNSQLNSDTHHDGALPTVKFDKIDRAGQSCANW
jgi:hypothetical protein